MSSGLQGTFNTCSLQTWLLEKYKNWIFWKSRFALGNTGLFLWVLSVWVFKSNQESWRGESLSLCIWRDGLQNKHTMLFKEITICAFLLCALWWLEVFPSQADDQLTQVNFYWGFWSIAQEVWSKKSGGMWHLISLAVRIKFKYPVGNVRSSVLFFVLINELFSCIDWERKLLCTLVQLNHSWRLSVVGQLSPASFF